MIPVAAARTIAECHDQDIVILVGWEQQSNKTNIVTYGVTPDQKAAAAAGSDKIKQTLGLGEQPETVYEDYRRSGERAEAFDELLKSCKAAMHAYGSLLAVRDGLTDEFLERLRDTVSEAIRKAEG